MALKEDWEKDESAIFQGWDFSYLKGRVKQDHDNFNYVKKAIEISKNKIILDMGTGGGELFSKIAPYAKKAYATETYKPNIPVAKQNLNKLNVEVFGIKTQDRLPFKDEFFEVVLNKHEYFNSKEVFRVLKKGGIFLTQQVDGTNLDDLVKFFNSKNKYLYWNLKYCLNILEKENFKILEKKYWEGKEFFFDVGAIVYTLKAIPWIIENFSVATHLSYLMKLQEKIEKQGHLEFSKKRFFIKSEKK